MPQLKRKVRDVDFSLKELDDEGNFSGYASVFDATDYYKEQVAPGAFLKSLAKWSAKGRLPPVLWQHDARQPLGPFTKMVEDAKGLYVEGKLLVDEVPRAREARALMKAKAVTGLSIGIDVVAEEFNKETKLTTLKEVDLWETSVVTFPALEVAQIESVKSLYVHGGEWPSLKEFEAFLRDAGGFPRSVAKAIVGHGYAAVRRDAGEVGIDAKSILDDVFRKPIITLEDLKI